MARTIEQIKQEMTTAFMSDASAQTAYGFKAGETFGKHFGKASIENILFYVFAVCAYAIERLTESHLAEVSETVAALRPHTLTWYQRKAMAFRYGDPTFDDAAADYTAEEDDDTVKPVSQCAVTEAEDGGLVFKVATTDDEGSLTALNTERLSAFTQYINRVKDAGVRTTIISRAGDRLKLDLTVYVDGTVYNEQGQRLEEADYPVQDAIREYLTMLPFNGELVLEHLTDYLQAVVGVEVPHVNSAQSAAIEAGGQTEDGYGGMADVDIRVTPESGYFLVSFDEADSWASSIEYRFKP